MKVLIVEDSESVRQTIKRVIREQVDEFVECSDGSDALAQYREHHPDIVLMDIKMNRVDGLIATREIKKSFSDARVVVVSQWDTPALREAAKESGAESYICKRNLLPLRHLLKVAQTRVGKER